MTTVFPTRLPLPTPLRVATATLCLMLGGCTVYGDWFGSNSTDYKNHAKRTQPLEVPPDLSQLSRDSRYLPQGGTISASELNKPAGPGGAASGPVEGAPAAAPAAAAVAALPASVPAVVALNSAGDVRLERQGDQRWLSTRQSPDQVWPQLREYWLSKGFAIKEEDPQTGVMSTDWLEDKTKLPASWINRTLGGVFSGLFDSGMRDRYRTRLERNAEGGTEIFVTHFGAMEEVTGFDKSEVEWVPRASDPNLEGQVLSEMMLALAGVARTPANVAAAPAPASAVQPAAQGPDEYNAALIANAATLPPVSGAAPTGAPRARIVPDQPGATMQVDDNFDRTWRRVGLALDHGGFTVEDRDRAQGLYFVRFVDAKAASKEEPGILSKIEGWFGMTGPSPVGKYRISIKGNTDNTSTVTVLNDQGQPDKSENPTRMVALLVDELK